MYRRIEIINHWEHEDGQVDHFMHGLCGGWSVDGDIPFGDLKSPKHLRKNCRFFFTEAGWNKYGRSFVKFCKEHGQEYRVIAIKENERDVFYKDQWQVAVRAKPQY